MTESHSSESHHGPSIKAYLVVFGALVVFTAVSFVVNYAVRHGSISSYTGFTLILGVAVCKAVLVGMYFMHLLVDWGKVFVLIVPALVLGPMLVVVLLPDMVLGWIHMTDYLGP